MNNEKKQIILQIGSLFFIIAFSFIFGSLRAYATRINPDFPIIFDGAFRIGIGQLPYKDFFIPVGPVTFYLQSFFNNFFGATYFSMIFHAYTAGSIYALLFYHVTRQELGSIAASIMAFFSYLSLYGIIGFPWYNQTAYFFFLTNMLLLIHAEHDRDISNRTIFLSSFLTFLSIFSKHDVGFLHFASVSLFFFFGYSNNRFKKSGVYIGILTFLVLASAMYFDSIGSFMHSIFESNESTGSRLRQIIAQLKITDCRVILALAIFSWLLFKRQANQILRRQMLLVLITITVPLICSATSGQSYATELQGITIILYLAYLILSDKANLFQTTFSKKNIKIFMILICIILIQPFHFLIKNRVGINVIIPNIFNHASFSKYSHLFKERSLNFIRVEDGSFKNVLINKIIYENLEKHILNNQNIKGFVNISRYTFLNVDMGIEPPKGLPLWFHKGVTYANKDFGKIKERVVKISPSLILFEDIHYLTKKEFNSSLKYFLNHGYKLIFRVEKERSGEPTIVLLEKVK